jgi:hypothetical protein
MGRLSRLTGRIQISPPLRWADFKDSEFRESARENRAVVFVEQTESQDTVDGVIERRAAVALVPCTGDSAKFYDLEDDLTLFVHEHGDARTLTGYLVREGDEQGDVERYSIVDGLVVREKAELRWPDGTAVTS